MPENTDNDHGCSCNCGNSKPAAPAKQELDHQQLEDATGGIGKLPRLDEGLKFVVWTGQDDIN